MNKEAGKGKIVIVITLLIFALVAAVYGYNMYLPQAQENAEVVALEKEPEVASLSLEERAISFFRESGCSENVVCGDITIYKKTNSPLTEEDKARGVKQKTRVIATIEYTKKGNHMQRNDGANVLRMSNGDLLFEQ